MKNKTCRICLSESNMNISLFQSNNGSKFSEIIKEYIGIELTEKHNLPTGLCEECVNDIKNVVKFITKFKQSSLKLHDTLIWNIPRVFLVVTKQEDVDNDHFYDFEDGTDCNITNDQTRNPHEVFINDFDDSEDDISLHQLKSKTTVEHNGETFAKVKDNKENKNSNFDIKKCKKQLATSKKQRKRKFNQRYEELPVIKEEDICEIEIKNEVENELLSSKEKKIEGTIKPGTDIESKYVILNKNDHVLKKDMYKCLTCGILSVNKSAFIVHYRRHSGDRPYSCKFCKMKCTQTGTLNAHLKKRHYREWLKMKLVSKKVKELKEQECLKLYKVEEHKDTNGDNVVKRRIACHICGRTYYHKYGLNLHMKIHNIDQQFQCQYCPRKFVRTGDRILHVRIHHTGEKPYCCHVCGKKFPSGTNLKKHLVAHSEERKFKCSVCNKGMKSNDNLKRHILVMHDGTRSKVCHVCGKSFALQYRLNVHMKNWHENKKTSATCNICNKSYRNIEKHMKRHMDIKPHRCTMCHKSFLQEKHLLLHMKKHANDTATFKCSYESCESAFVKKCMLEYHILKYHLKHTPYVCQMCNRGFYRSKDLGRHMKLKHNTSLNCAVFKEGL